MLWNAVVYCVEHSEFFHRRKKMNRDFYTIVAHILTLKHSCQYKYTQRHTCGSNIPPKTEPYDTTPTNRFDSVKMCAWHLMCVHSWAELTWYHFFFFRFCTTTDYGLRCFFFVCDVWDCIYPRDCYILTRLGLRCTQLTVCHMNANIHNIGQVYCFVFALLGISLLLLFPRCSSLHYIYMLYVHLFQSARLLFANRSVSRL